MIEEIDRERRYAEEERMHQEAEADRIAKSRQIDANKAIRDQAEAEGTKDYLYQNEQGILETALAPEQKEQIRKDQEAERTKKAEQDAAAFRVRDIDRDLATTKSTLLTDSGRSRMEADLEKKRQALQMWQTEISEGRVSAEDAKEDIEAIDREVTSLQSEIDRDTANRNKADELQQKKWDMEDLRDGRPDNMPRAVPSDPEERKGFLDSYNTRVQRLNSESAKIAEHAAQKATEYEQRVTELRTSYDQWLQQGVTPEQQRKGLEKLNSEIVGATKQYLQSRFEYDRGIKSIKDEEKELSLLAPFVGDVASAHKTWIDKTNEEAKKLYEEGRKKIIEQYDTTSKEFGRLSPDAQKKINEAKQLMLQPLPENATKEEKEARAKQINDLEGEAFSALQRESKRHNEITSLISEMLVNRAGGNMDALKNLGNKGFQFKKNDKGEMEWMLPITKNASTGASLEAIDGNVAENAVSALTGAAVNLGEQITILGYKAVGKGMQPSKMIREAQQKLNLPDDQMAIVLNDIALQHKDWDDKETTRVLHDGTILINPSLNILDKNVYVQAIESSSAPSYMKKHMLNEATSNAYRQAAAVNEFQASTTRGAMMAGVPTPQEWHDEHYKGKANPPALADWMAEYRKYYGKENAGMLQDAQAIAHRRMAGSAIGVGKLLQTIAGLGAVFGIDKAIDVSTALQQNMDNLKKTRDAVGGEIPFYSVIDDVIREEAPSLLISVGSGGAGGFIGKSLTRQAITKGLLREGSKEAAKLIARSQTLGAVVGSGVQSAGLSIQSYYDTALKQEEKRLGRKLTDEERYDLVGSSRVQGKAIVQGIITMGATAAFGAPLESTLLSKVAGGAGTKYTVRDFVTALSNKSMSTKQVFERLGGAVKDIAKASGMEGAEEAADEFISTLALEPGASMDEALERAWQGGKAGLILGGAVSTVTSATSSGVNSINASDPQSALAALKDAYGKEAANYTQPEVEEALRLINYQPNKGGQPDDVVVRNLKTAIDTNNSITAQRNEAVSELQRATDSGDKKRIELAERQIQNLDQARAIIRVASGTSVQDLTFAEQKQIRNNLPTGVPVSYEKNGELVISDDAISAVAKMFPEAARDLVSLSETGRLEQINRKALEAAAIEKQAAAEASASANAPVATETAPSAAAATTATATATPAATSAPAGGKQSGTYRVGIRSATGEMRMVEVQAGSKNEAATNAASLAKEGEMVVTSQVQLVAAPAAPAATATATPEAGAAPDAQFQGEAAAAAAPSAPKTQIEKISDAVGGAFASVEEAAQDELPSNQNWSLDADNRLKIRAGLTPQQTIVATAEAMSAVASRKALSDNEASAMYAALPPAIRQLVKKRAKVKTGRDLSDQDAARYFLENLLTDKVFSSTLKTAAKKGDKKFVAGALKYLRMFIDSLRAAMNFASPYAKKQLRFYEDVALAILKETTSAAALTELGISLPETRLNTTEDVTLPDNVRKTSGGMYEVLMPTGKWVSARTREDALAVNATKFETKFNRDIRVALTAAAASVDTQRDPKKRLDRSTVEGNIVAINRMIEAISGKVGISKEWFYSKISSNYVGGEINAILDAISKGNGGVATSELVARMRSLNSDVQTYFNDESLPAGVRRALAASKLATSIMADVANGEVGGIVAAREAQASFLKNFGSKESKESAEKLQSLLKAKDDLMTEAAAMGLESYLEAGAAKPTHKKVKKHVNKFKKDLDAIDAQIEQYADEVNKAYAAEARKDAKVRGFHVVDKQTTKSLLGFSAAADATTVLHEFVHVLQGLVDPRTGKSVLEAASGTKRNNAMEQWLDKTFPGESKNARLEGLAQAMEAYLADGGYASALDPDLQKAFSAIAAGAQRALTGNKALPGHKLNADTKAILDAMFAIEPVMDNTMQAKAGAMQGMLATSMQSLQFVGDGGEIMILPTLNNSKQVGFSNKKAAVNLAAKLAEKYDGVGVIEHKGKFYAAMLSPKFGSMTMVEQMSDLPNFSIEQGIEIASNLLDVIKNKRKMLDSKVDFFTSIWAKAMRKTGVNLKPSTRNVGKAVDIAIDDIADWLKNNKRFLDYYENDWKTVRSIMNAAYPKMTDDQFDLFRMITGVTSPSTPLSMNMVDAVNFIEHYMKHGNFDAFEIAPNQDPAKKGNLMVTASPFSINSNTGVLKVKSIKVMEDMHKKLGSWKAVLSYLQESVTMDELQDIKTTYWKGKITPDYQRMIQSVVQEATGQSSKIPRMFIFGPKVGAYTLNNTGDSRYTTTDIWESRFIRSYFPSLFAINGVDVPATSQELELFQKFSSKFIQRFAEKTGIALTPAAAQSARWFYVIAKMKSLGYKYAQADGTISQYTANAIEYVKQSGRGRYFANRGRSVVRSAGVGNEIQLQSAEGTRRFGISPALARWHRPSTATAQPEGGIAPGENEISYAQALMEARAAQKMGSALTSVTPEDMIGKEMYVFADGRGGVSVAPDGDLVAGFKHPDSKENFRELLVALGDNHPYMRTLDCYDINGFLPTLYHKTMGFQPVAKIAFNQNLTEADFDTDTLGKPDVVLMARIPGDAFADYNSVRDSVPVFATWDEAVAHRAKVIADTIGDQNYPVDITENQNQGVANEQITDTVQLQRADQGSDSVSAEGRRQRAQEGRLSPSQRRGMGGDQGWTPPSGSPYLPSSKPALVGLPQTVKVDGNDVTFGPFEVARKVAEDYMREAGLEYNPPKTYAKVNKARARRIAAEYDKMAHAPQDPEVLRSYRAMMDETLAQYEAIKKTGLKIEPMVGGVDPYGNPRNAILDVVQNNHLWFFPTNDGFGSGDFDPVDNPLLEETGEVINGHKMLVNDVFRVVHDYFGHIKEGVGFRADGEENAWRSHSAMYSPLARRAMTSETRGQNSWVNFGPYAEENRTANGAETQYADQKIGLLPDWVVNEGAGDEDLQVQLQESSEPIGDPELVKKHITKNYGKIFKELGVSYMVRNFGYDAYLLVNEREGAQLFFNAKTLSQDTMDQLEATIREEMIHAASYAVITRDATSKFAKYSAYAAYHKNLYRAMQQGNLVKTATNIYTSAADVMEIAAEFKRMAIQKMLYGKVTEQEMNSKAFKMIEDLLKWIVDYFNNLVKKFGSSKDAQIFQDTIDLIRKVDPNAARPRPLRNKAKVGTEYVNKAQLQTETDLAELDRPDDMVTARPGDWRRLKEILGDKMYGENPGYSVAKEVFQNAVDAVMKNKANVDKPRITFASRSRVPYRDNSEASGSVFVMADNGAGMTPKDVVNKYIPPFVSGKAVGEGGGYGVAKFAFLGGPHKVAMKTITEIDGKKILTELTLDKDGYVNWIERIENPPVINVTPGKGLQNPVPGVYINIVEVPSQIATGTAYFAHFPSDPDVESWEQKWQAYDVDKFMDEAAKFTPEIEVMGGSYAGYVDSLPFDIGGDLDSSEKIKDVMDNIRSYRVPQILDLVGINASGITQTEESKKSGDFGVMKAIETNNFYLEVIAPNGAIMQKPSWGGKVTLSVLNRTILQFTAQVEAHEEGMYPEGMAINIRSKVKAGESGYPFTINRENISKEVAKVVGEYLTEVGLAAGKKMQEKWNSQKDSAKTIDGTEGKLLDVSGVVSQEIIDEVASNTIISKVHKHYAKIQNAILRVLDRRFKNVKKSSKSHETRTIKYGRAKFAGFMFGSGAYGVHFGKPKSDEGTEIWHDPFLTYAFAVDETNRIKESTNPDGNELALMNKGEYAVATYETFLRKIAGVAFHEALHQEINEEGVGLARELTFMAGDMVEAMISAGTIEIDEDFAISAGRELTHYNEVFNSKLDSDEAKKFFSSQGAAGYLSAKDQTSATENAQVQLQNSNADAAKKMKSLGLMESKKSPKLTDEQENMPFYQLHNVFYASVRPSPGKFVKLTDNNAGPINDYYTFLYTNAKDQTFGLHYDTNDDEWLITPLDEKGQPARRFPVINPVTSRPFTGNGREYYTADTAENASEVSLLVDELEGYDPEDEITVSLQGEPKSKEEGAARAAARMKQTPASRVNQMFQDRSARDAKGEKVVKGDPSRANISPDMAVRDAYDVSKEIYEENFVQQNWNSWEQEANRILGSKPVADIELEIFRAAEGGGSAGTPGFQIAAKRVVADRLQKAMSSGNQADIDYALRLAQAEQEMRGEIARSMTAMRDPFQSPAQRTAYALGTAITTAPTSQVTALKKRHGAKDGEPVPKENREAFDEDLRKLQKHRIEEAGKVLDRHGIDIKEVFNATKEGAAIGTAIDKEILATMTDKQQQVIKMMREGAEPKAIKIATGVEEEAQKRAMEKYRDALRAKVQNLVEQGYTADTMDRYAKGELPPEGAKPGTKADVEKIMDTSFSARTKPKEGFNINDPRHVMAAARALDDIDLDWISRSVGTWYANVFSMKTIVINLLAIPFAGYRMVAERVANSVVNAIANNPEAQSIEEFKYIKDGLKQFYKMAIWQAYVAYDTEHAYFHTFSKGEGDPIRAAAGQTHEDVRGYQMGHILDYIDIGLEKMGVKLRRPSMVRRHFGQKGAMTNVSAGKAARGVLRFNLGVDEFMRFIIAGGEVGAIAYRLGKAKGLRGDQLKKFVTNEMTVEGSSSWKMASEQADISVFTADLPSPKKGTINNFSDALAALMNGFDGVLKNWDKSLAAEKVVYSVTADGMSKLTNLARLDAARAGIGLARITLMPFTRVLMNLMRQGFKRVPNPFSLVWSVAKVAQYAAYNRGKSDPEAAKAIDTMSSQIMSWCIAAALMSMMEGDDDDRTKKILITGSMPKFGEGAQENRDAAMREGMGPYRIRVGTGKDAMTFDYGRIDPLAITLGTTVDWIRAIKKNVRGDQNISETATTLIADTLVGQMTDKTMLRGMNDTFMMMSGKSSFSKYAARQLATFLVPNLIRQPIRDANTTYDASVTESGMEGFAKSLIYELYPNSDEKLGGALPKNPMAPPASRDAYGETEKRPNTPMTLADWVFRPMPYTPNRFDEMVRRDRRANPEKDIRMPGELAKSYTHTDPLTGNKENLKLTPAQYEILQNIYRNVWRQERIGITNSEDLEKARRVASQTAWEIAKANPRFMLEARKTSEKNKK